MESNIKDKVEFKAGDVVKLKSFQQCLMTVEEVNKDSIKCTWGYMTDNREICFKSRSFSYGALEGVKKD